MLSRSLKLQQLPFPTEVRMARGNTWCPSGKVAINGLGVLAAAATCWYGCGSESSSGSAQETRDAGGAEGAIAEDPSSGPQCAEVECLSDLDCCRSEPRACEATCDNGTCAFVCDSDTFCPKRVPVCNAGSCVQCAADDECTGTSVCRSNKCSLACQTAAYCPVMHTCSDGICLPNRCADDGDCVQITGNQQAVCSDAGSCEAACADDSECTGFDLLLNNAVCTDGSDVAPD